MDLNEREQTPETILDVLKDSIAELMETIEQEHEHERALKVSTNYMLTLTYVQRSWLYETGE